MSPNELKNEEIKFLGLVILLIQARDKNDVDDKKKIEEKLEEIKRKIGNASNEEIIKNAVETVFSTINGGHS